MASPMSGVLSQPLASSVTQLTRLAVVLLPQGDAQVTQKGLLVSPNSVRAPTVRNCQVQAWAPLVTGSYWSRSSTIPILLRSSMGVRAVCSLVSSENHFPGPEGQLERPANL